MDQVQTPAEEATEEPDEEPLCKREEEANDPQQPHEDDVVRGRGCDLVGKLVTQSCKLRVRLAVCAATIPTHHFPHLVITVYQPLRAHDCKRRRRRRRRRKTSLPQIPESLSNVQSIIHIQKQLHMLLFCTADRNKNLHTRSSSSLRSVQAPPPATYLIFLSAKIDRL